MIHVQVIPHKDQRYPTCGDWQFLQDGLLVSVSDSGDEKTNALVAIHEIVEAFLCKYAGVSGADVDAFDMALAMSNSFEEPGDLRTAPYHLQHKTADLIERLVALQAGVDWLDHEQRIDALG